MSEVDRVVMPHLEEAVRSPAGRSAFFCVWHRAGDTLVVAFGLRQAAQALVETGRGQLRPIDIDRVAR